ncbi:MAG: molybdopterin cofactor-binding domain-containing protein [Bryobacteraceae bacterium]
MENTICKPDARLETEPKGVERRAFLTGGLSLAFLLPEVSRVAELQAATVPGQVNAWLNIAADGSVTLTVGASEMGQGSFSTLAQILAEELMVNYSRVRTVQGSPAMANPQPVGASLNTVGSSITRRNFWTMRDAGAAAREMLVTAAMNLKGDLTRANYTVADGVVRHSSGVTWTYGSLAGAASALPVPSNPPLVPDSQFRLIGRTQPRFDIPSKVDGSAVFGMDIRIPGMLYAIIKHGPTFGSTLKSPPRAPSGMQVVPTSVVAGTGRGTEVTGAVNAVAVVGPNTWDTWQAARRLSVSWKTPAAASSWNDAQFLTDGRALLNGGQPYQAGGANGPGTVFTVEGDAASAGAGLAASAKTVNAEYTLPYVAHATMEVLNCTVDYVAGNRCNIYAPTQNGRGVLSLAMQLTGLPESKIKVITTYLGGGLGRKAEQDFVSQAIQVAMAVGKPVKLMWPREEDFTRDQYRPMAVVGVSAGIDNSGNITGWKYRNVSPSILGQRGSNLGARGDSQGYEASQDLPYNIGARLTEWAWHPSPIPVGFWRSVGASINTFCVESMIDELAFAANQDPYLFRRSRLTDPRWISVLDAAADLSNWSASSPGRYRGIAIGAAFNSIVAQVVEVSSVTSSSLRVDRVWLAIDLYMPVNPGQIEAQMQGGIIHGLNAALYGQQTFSGGKAQATNFRNSRMIRANEAPQVAVRIMPAPASADRAANIGGAGELGVPTFAPALANAYFQATRTRRRSLPLFPGSRMGGL